MRSPDNSRYRPHYGMDTLKRVYADTGRRSLEHSDADDLVIDIYQLVSWVLQYAGLIRRLFGERMTANNQLLLRAPVIERIDMANCYL